MSSTGDPRKDRIAKNEAMFRAVNEVLREQAGPGAELEVTCECGLRECERILEVPARVYEQTRADPCRFLVLPGHELTDVEDLIFEGGGFNVVRKHEDAAEIVRDLDPRGDQGS